MTRTLWTLWVALLGGHVAWSAHLLASYFLASLACGSSAPGSLVPLHVATAVALAGMLGALAASRVLMGGATVEHRFVGRVGLALSAVFLVAIALAGAGALFLPPCA